MEAYGIGSVVPTTPHQIIDGHVSHHEQVKPHSIGSHNTADLPGHNDHEADHHGADHLHHDHHHEEPTHKEHPHLSREEE